MFESLSRLQIIGESGNLDSNIEIMGLKAHLVRTGLKFTLSDDEGEVVIRHLKFNTAAASFEPRHPTDPTGVLRVKSAEGTLFIIYFEDDATPYVSKEDKMQCIVDHLITCEEVQVGSSDSDSENQPR